MWYTVVQMVKTTHKLNFDLDSMVKYELSKTISKLILKDYSKSIKSRTEKLNPEIDTYTLRLHIMDEEQMANKEAVIKNILMESPLNESEVNKLMLDISKYLRI